jgi:hypothetical protein
MSYLSPSELFEKLTKEAQCSTGAAIVVISGNQGSHLVWAADFDPLKKLIGLIDEGGKPIGMVSYISNSENYSANSQLFPDYESDQNAIDWLENSRQGVLNTARTNTYYLQKSIC